MVVLIVLCLGVKLFCAAGALCMISYFKLNLGPTCIGKIAANSAYEMFSWYTYLIVSCFFPASVFGVGIFF